MAMASLIAEIARKWKFQIRQKTELETSKDTAARCCVTYIRELRADPTLD
jgi:hypothetical protein